MAVFWLTIYFLFRNMLWHNFLSGLNMINLKMKFISTGAIGTYDIYTYANTN